MKTRKDPSMNQNGSSSDLLIKATAFNATVRVFATVTTGLVGEACRRHSTTPTASAALGRVLTGTLMFGSTLKELERVTVKFDCLGPIGNITAEADAHGNVRGYVRNPRIELMINERGKLDVAKAVGTGMLYVLRDAGFEIGLGLQPYSGSVPIVTGEIGDDFAHYMLTSEQIPSAVGLGVFVDSDAQVTAAGGFMIQIMPGATDEVISTINDAVMKAPPITRMLREGYSLEQIISTVLGSNNYETLEQREVSFKCKCSHERALGLISALGLSEVQDMIEKDGQAELTCHFCSETYRISLDELQAIAWQLNKPTVG